MPIVNNSLFFIRTANWSHSSIHKTKAIFQSCPFSENRFSINLQVLGINLQVLRRASFHWESHDGHALHKCGRLLCSKSYTVLALTCQTWESCRCTELDTPTSSIQYTTRSYHHKPSLACIWKCLVSVRLRQQHWDHSSQTGSPPCIHFHLCRSDWIVDTREQENRDYSVCTPTITVQILLRR